eukprot:TRINITY_DN34187_c0_g1_i1.p1 TRINITY_DN34187_c0_g1~~TRINITY_DN34187_c0_g1_i1.p1  ORF type:complete len:632 (+),score=172.22 TRINITY_DN34187_c0_g1_i1:47-1897(+)
MAAALSTGGAIGSHPRLEALTIPKSPGGDVIAVGPTAEDGVFLVHIQDIGFKYLNLSGSEAVWTSAGSFAGSVSADFGLFHTRGSEAGAFVSLVEAPPQSWACYRLPSKESGKAELIGRISALPGDIQAVCAQPGDAAAAVALASGQVRFFDLEKGQSAGKGLKFEGSSGSLALARLGPCRAVLLRPTPAAMSLEFFIVALDMEAKKAVLQLRGMLRMAGNLMSLGSLQGAVAPGNAPGKDEVLLCWKQDKHDTSVKSGDSANGLLFASAVVDSKASQMCLLAPSAGKSATQCWLCISGYLVECAAAEKKEHLDLQLRDARFGMPAASGSVSLASSSKELLTCKSGSVMLLAAGQKLAAVRTFLPSFSLKMVVGKQAAGGARQAGADGAKEGKLLQPLREVVSGKRQRTDPEAEALFSAKRRAVSEEALVKELQQRLWRPSQELVEAIIQHRCWAAGSALLALPDLEEALAVKLLVARPEFLARVVRRCCAPHDLDVALQHHLPTASLPGILETLLEWLGWHRELTEKSLAVAAPGLPAQAEIVSFLRAVADGCLASVARLDEDLLERLVEKLTAAQADIGRLERLYGAVRAASRERKPLTAKTSAPKIEVSCLEL